MTDTAETAEVDDSAEPTFLRPPSACGTEFEQVAWVGTLAVHLLDRKYAGIQFNDQRLMDAVARRLGDRVTEPEGNVPAYYSVKLNAPTRRRQNPMHYVYLGARPVVGTRDVSRLLDGLAAHVGQHLEVATDVYTSHGIPVRTPAGVLLVPSDLLLMSKVVDRVLRPAGYVTADVPFVHLDLDAAAVVVPESALSLKLDEATIAALPASEADQALAPGRYPIARWLVPVGAEEAGPLRHAQAVLHVTRSLKTPFPHGAQAAVNDVARVAKDVPVLGVTWASDEELVQAVLEAGRS